MRSRELLYSEPNYDGQSEEHARRLRQNRETKGHREQDIPLSAHSSTTNLGYDPYRAGKPECRDIIILRTRRLQNPHGQAHTECRGEDLTGRSGTTVSGN